MASVDVAADKPKCDAMLVDKLPEEINEMKIKDEKVEKEIEAAVVDGNGTEIGHIIVTPKQMSRKKGVASFGDSLFEEDALFGDSLFDEIDYDTHETKDSNPITSSTSSEMSDFVANITNASKLAESINTIGEISNDISGFQGFNPRQVAAKFLRLARGRSIQDVTKDISRIVLIGLMRGNIRSDQLAKTSGDGVRLIKELANRYQIPMRKHAKDRRALSDDTLTFVRGLSVFPKHASMIIYKRPSIVEKNPPDKCGSSSCPAVLKHSGAASLIPKSAIGGVAYLLAHVAYMLDFWCVLNPDSRKRPIGMRYQHQMRVAKFANDSDMIKEADRVAFFKTVGLDSKESYEAAMKAANTLLSKLDKDKPTAPSIDAEEQDLVLWMMQNLVPWTDGDDQASSSSSFSDFLV